MENALKAKPEDVQQQLNSQSRISRKPIVKQCWSCVLEKIGIPVRQGSSMIATIRQRLQEEGYFVSISKLCQETGWVFLGARCITTQSRPTQGAKAVPAWKCRSAVTDRFPISFLLRSDNGLVFTNRNYIRVVRSYGLRQKFITPHAHSRMHSQALGSGHRKTMCVPPPLRNLATRDADISYWVHFYSYRQPPLSAQYENTRLKPTQTRMSQQLNLSRKD